VHSRLRRAIHPADLWVHGLAQSIGRWRDCIEPLGHRETSVRHDHDRLRAAFGHRPQCAAGPLLQGPRPRQTRPASPALRLQRRAGAVQAERSEVGAVVGKIEVEITERTDMISSRDPLTDLDGPRAARRACR